MKKIILSVLVLSVLVMMIGSVSADVDFLTPAEGDEVGGDVLVSWENGTYATSNLMYHEGDCDGSLPGEFITLNIDAEDDETWDVSELDEGDYCLKIADGTTLHSSLNITVDNTAPVVEFEDAPYFGQIDEEIDELVSITDNGAIDEWTIDFGDGSDLEEGSAEGDIALQHTYDEEDEYIITVTATDEAGNEASATTMVLVSEEEPDWIIPLFADDTMNMFSIPLIPESTDIEDVLPEEISDNAEKIWTYQEGEWKYNTPTTTGWSTTSTRIQNIEPGYGYIIFMTDDAVAYGYGKELGADVPPEVTLTTGWNLVGHYGEEIDVDVSEAFSSLELGEDDYMNSVLTVTDGEFESLEETDELAPTEAYWLSIKSLNLEEDELRYFTYFPAQECY